MSKGVRARLRAGSRRGFDEPACASLRLPCDARASGQVRKLGPEYRASNSADLDRKRSDPDTLCFSAAHRRPSGCPPAALPDAVRCSAMSRSTLVPQGRGRPNPAWRQQQELLAHSANPGATSRPRATPPSSSEPTCCSAHCGPARWVVWGWELETPGDPTRRHLRASQYSGWRRKCATAKTTTPAPSGRYTTENGNPLTMTRRVSEAHGEPASGKAVAIDVDFSTAARKRPPRPACNFS